MSASEKEQIEALGKWWKENGSSIITGLLLGVSILLGGKAWMNYQDTQSQNASNIYAQMMAESQTAALDKARTHANELITNYTGSSYAPLAALLLARLAVQDGELAAAQGQLQWALDHTTSPQLTNTARLRLIRVQVAQQQYTQAEQLLASATDTGAYAYLYTELEGDLAAAQNKTQQAAAAYKKALDSSPAQAPNRGLLTAKYENLSGVDAAE